MPERGKDSAAWMRRLKYRYELESKAEIYFVAIKFGSALFFLA
jgi:hypothetical protein